MIIRKKHSDEKIEYDALNREKGWPKDSDGHGTHVAGIIAAKPRDHGSPIGLAGIPNFVKLIICKYTSYKDKDGLEAGTISDAIKCIDYAKKRRLKLLIAVGALRRIKMMKLKF